MWYFRESDQVNCLAKFKKRREHRILRVGKKYEYDTLKSALACANE